MYALHDTQSPSRSFGISVVLHEDRYIDYEKYIRAIDPSIPHSFLQQIIDHIVLNDGRVTSITFKNGSTHTFTYKT